MKFCPKCRKEREIAEYYRRSPYCKPCTSVYQKDHRERRNEQARTYYHNNRKAVIEAYGGKCNCCGESHPLFLEIDHINGGGTAERRANKDIESFYRRLLKDKPEGFQVLCSNCNRGRWRNKGICPHQEAKQSGAN